MGKPKGDANRSKYRPASSNLAATLAQTETPAFGFGGYIGSTRVEPTSTNFSNTSLDIDGEMLQHLRRVSKKDSTTKVKALASLSSQFRETSSKELCQIVPIWVFEYKKLVLDNSRQVRQAAQNAMGSLAISVGKGLAPHLKSLMGAWWLARFDPFTEVSEAAIRSFEEAFSSEKKRSEALIFCQNDIFLYLEENLKLTPQTISDKTSPAEELEEMYERVMSATLLAWASLLEFSFHASSQMDNESSSGLDQKMLTKVRSGAIAAAEKVCSSQQYFKNMLKSQSHRVRSAVYRLLAVFVKFVPHVFSEGDLKTSSNIVLGLFQEQEPSCHSSMWDLVLLFSSRISESWNMASVQKVVLPRLWCFLRKGCYGSQKMSYPCLLPLLSSIPPKILTEDYIINFLQSLWIGSSSVLILSANQVALFNAIKECFAWVIRNTSRYLEEEEGVKSFRVKLVDMIIVRLLWCSYISAVKGKSLDKSDKLPVSILSSEQKNEDNLLPTYPSSFIVKLGNTIIDILMDLSTFDFELVNAFCNQFQIEAFKMMNQSDNDTSSGNTCFINRLSQFFSLLGARAQKKENEWIMIYLVKPFVTNSLSLVSSKGSPEAFSLLSVIISAFGPNVLSLEDSVSKGGENITIFGKNTGLEPQMDELIRFFKSSIIKWCLDDIDHCASSKLDLLLSFLETDSFQEHWDWIVGCATGSETEPFDKTCFLDKCDRIIFLTMLMEKIRSKFIASKFGEISAERVLAEARRWNSRRLDNIAISVACATKPLDSACCDFLRSVLGGATEMDVVPIISKEAVNLVMESLVKHVIASLVDPCIDWTKHASSLMVNGNTESKDEILEIAVSAVQVICGSFFSLKVLDGDFQVVSHVLALPFLFRWKNRSLQNVAHDTITRKSPNGYNENEYSEIIASLDSSSFQKDPYIIDQEDESNDVDFEDGNTPILARPMQSLWSIVVSCCKSFRPSTLLRLRWILIEVNRYIISNQELSDGLYIFDLCSEWVMEVISHTCQDDDEEQEVLDHLFLPSQGWPLWAKQSPDCIQHLSINTSLSQNHDSEDHVHAKYLKLMSNIALAFGWDKLLFNSKTKISNVVVEKTIISVNDEISYCRLWLAIEVLCTWKWSGGSAIQSLMPSLSKYAISNPESSQRIMLDSLLELMFLSAKTSSTIGAFSHINAWTVSENDVDNITEPFLRSLVSVLIFLFKDRDVWTARDAYRILLDHILKEDFVETSSDFRSLIVDSYVLQVLAPILRNGTAEPEGTNELSMIDHVQQFACKWISQILSKSPLICKVAQPDSWSWFHMVISCFSLSSSGAKETICVSSKAIVSVLESEMLFELFQKQLSQEAMSEYRAKAIERQVSIASGTLINNEQEQRKELCLARLIIVTVGHCWKNFGESEWSFVFSNMRRWLDAVVSQTEEQVEIIEDIVKNDASLLAENTLCKIKNTMKSCDEYLIHLGEAAVFIFSLVYSIQNLENEETAEVLNNFRSANWERVEVRAFEAVLRLFISSGISESIATSSCAGQLAGAIIAHSRKRYINVWNKVSNVVLFAPPRAKESAVRAADLWGLSKGSITALYSLIFSVYPIPALQLAAYEVLSNDPISHIAILGETVSSFSEEISGDETSQFLETASASEALTVRPELHCVLQLSSEKLLDSQCISQTWVHYLLAWSVFLMSLNVMPPQSPARERLVQYIQETRCTLTLLDCLFQHILSRHIKSPGSKKKGSSLASEATAAATAAKQASATSSLSFAVHKLWPLGVEEIGTLAGAVYGLLLRVLPAYVRDWYSTLRDRSKASNIEAFTAIWCSTELLDDEFSQIQGSDIADENLSIKANRSSREITAAYRKEEAYMDVLIRLPACYPLRNVELECKQQLGVSETRQRKWILSMAAFIRNQNGAIAEAIRIWKRNIDREFEGVEDCPICYSITHTTDHSLPRLACRTCKHKFHSACIYKWFSTSNKSTCPLCQTPFH